MTEFLIQKYSLFVDKQCKSLLDSIIEVFDGSFPNDLNQNESKSKIKKEPVNELEMMSNLTISDKLCCTVCNAPFIDRDEQVLHYKSDLHRFNLKRKLDGKVSVTAEEFENLTEVSSISGSDSTSESDSESISDSDDDKQQNYAQIMRNQPKIAFKLNDSNILVMHRCLLHGKKNHPENSDDLINSVKTISNQDQWCIILVNAGHFASAIFRGEEVILHKTFHRYVVRAKRGTVQSVHDNAGGHARSAGANIRRHHEAAFKDDIKSLMDQWKKELDKCKCIFLRAPKYNQQIFFSGKMSIFSKFDMRIRNIPFMTFRPTFNEVKRVHFTLRTLELYNSFYTLNNKAETKQKNLNSEEEKKNDNTKNIVQNQASAVILSESSDDYDSDEEFNKCLNATTNKKQNKRKLKPLEKEEIKKPKESSPTTQQTTITPQINLDNNSLKIFNELYSACITNDQIKLSTLLEKYKLNDNNNSDNYLNNINLDRIINHRFDKLGLTLLHLTSSLGYAECVKILLLNGSDPTISANDKKVPYLMSKTKSVRDHFRRFMHDYPLLYDYSLTKIPSGLSLEKEIEKQTKEKEKKKLQRKLKKEREEEAKNTQKQAHLENEDKRKFLLLNDEEKRMLMIERKFINTQTSKTKAQQKDLPVIKLLDQINPENLPKIISRCWYCAENMSTNVPFEYFDYKFCSMKCLKTHRQTSTKSAENKKSTK